MAQHANGDEELQERANELYWASDESVNSIADELDVSKGSLYHLVRPLPAGLPCPRCGSEVEYPNRTARDKGFVTCPACELEEDEDVVREAMQSGRSGDAIVIRPSLGEGGRHRLRSGGLEGRNRGRIVAGAALLGAAVGLAVALWARKK